MNQFVIQNPGIVSIIEHTVSRNKDVRLYQKIILKRFHIKPVHFSYVSANSVQIKVLIEVRFGIDVLKTMDKLSNEIKTNLEKMAKITTKAMELVVKGVYDEKKEENSKDD